MRTANTGGYDGIAPSSKPSGVRLTRLAFRRAFGAQSAQHNQAFRNMESFRNPASGRRFLPISGFHIVDFPAFFATEMRMRFQICVESHPCRVIAWHHSDKSMLAKKAERTVDRRKRKRRKFFPEVLVNRIGERMSAIRLEELQDCNPLHGDRNAVRRQKGAKRLSVRFHVCVVRIAEEEKETRRYVRLERTGGRAVFSRLSAMRETPKTGAP